MSITITDASGRTLSGQTTEACWNSIAHAKPLGIGLNCALGADAMRSYLQSLSKMRIVMSTVTQMLAYPTHSQQLDTTKNRKIQLHPCLPLPTRGF